MAEFDISLKSKVMSTFDLGSCVFCCGKFTAKNKAITPDLRKIDGLFIACHKRTQGNTFNKVAHELLSHQQDILDGITSFRFHRSCRASFGSKDHINRDLEKRKAEESAEGESVSGMYSLGGGACSVGGGDGSESSVSKCFTRSSLSFPTFNWKDNCFVCGKKCHPCHKRYWSLVESSIGTSAQNIYVKMFDAATRKGDQEMLARLSGAPGGDLVAVEARYHRHKACYVNYTSAKGIISTAIPETDNNNIYQTKTQYLVDEFTKPIMDELQVFLFTTLKTRFEEIAEEHDVELSPTYTKTHLRNQLEKIWPDLRFIPQPPRSHIVCSGKLTVDDH